MVRFFLKIFTLLTWSAASFAGGLEYPEYYPSVTYCNELLSGVKILETGDARGLGLFATQTFSANEVVHDLSGAVELDHPTIFSVQVSETQHIDHPVMGRLNHSQEPNVFIDVESRKIVALKTLKPGDLLTIYYPSTEWDMASPFVSEEGTPVRGAKYVKREELGKYRLSPHILRLLAAQESI